MFDMFGLGVVFTVMLYVTSGIAVVCLAMQMLILYETWQIRRAEKAKARANAFRI